MSKVLMGEAMNALMAATTLGTSLGQFSDAAITTAREFAGQGTTPYDRKLRDRLRAEEVRRQVLPRMGGHLAGRRFAR